MKDFLSASIWNLGERLEVLGELIVALLNLLFNLQELFFASQCQIFKNARVSARVQAIACTLRYDCNFQYSRLLEQSALLRLSW